MDELKSISEKMFQDCACLNLRKANRALTRFYDNLLSPADIRSTQLPILVSLARSGAVTIAQLAKLTVMEQSTLTRNLKLLIERKLIRVQPGQDKRTREVHLTEQGAQMIRDAHPLWLEAQARIAEELGQPHFQQLLAISAATIHATRPA